MPNAIIVSRLKPHNQVKPSTMVKVEKENENTDIRRRMKNVNKGRLYDEKADGSQNKLHIYRLFSFTDRVLNTKQETVWERLSKVRKSTSNESGLVSSSKNRMMTRTKSSVRLPILRNSTNQSQKKPLSAPNPNTNVKRSSEKKQQQQMSQQTHIRLKSKAHNELLILPPMPPLPPRMVLPDEIPFCKPVKEILTVRTMNNSKSSSDESKDSEKKPSLPYLFRRANSIGCTQKYEITELRKPRLMIESSSLSQGSVDDFDLPSRGGYMTEEMPLNSSVKIQHNFERLLKQKQKSMPAEEIRLIKNVVKSDDRYRQLRRTDEKLFKDILKTQLREILKQGTVVKSALHHLSSKDSESLTMLPATGSPGKPGSSTDVQQVDVIFKNVPTLEKEIIILRALGEKLEATLKRTVGPSKSPPRKSAVSPTSRTKRSAFLMYDATRIGKIAHRVVGVQCLATVHVRSRGIARTLGFVREFYIAHKTIVELKNEANRHFYLPLNGPRMELKRTNFQRLKQNPNILMQHLKPKNPDVAFNVLEQDPIFFHSMLSNAAATAGSIWNNNNISARTSSEEESPVIVSLCEGGDSTKILQNKDTKGKNANTIDACILNNEVINYSDLDKKGDWKHSCSPKLAEIIDADEKVQLEQQNSTAITLNKQMLVEPPKRRRRIRRTPMPVGKYVAPKNNLFKTILVGGIQISCFLLLIMAITYPDFKC